MNFWHNIIIVICLTGLVSACGVNGRPELPPGVDETSKDEPSVLDELI